MEAEGEGRLQRWSAAELGMRLGDWISRRRGRREDVQSAYLFAWPEWPLGSQEMPAGVGVCNKAMSKGRTLGGKDLCHSLEVGAEREGRPQQVPCCRARDETGGWGVVCGEVQG